MTSSTSAEALGAAGIGPGRRGQERLRALNEAEPRFYRWILTRFWAGTPPAPDDLADAASRFDLDVQVALERLQREDLVHHDADTGAILVAYPFSARPTAHRVRIDGREVYAMCAIDALGIAPMVGRPIEIASLDPLTGEDVEVELQPDGHGTWHPQGAVVVAGRTESANSCDSCCPVLNFFASTTNAERWLANRPALHGMVISLPDAIAAGRVVFGDLLTDA
jgi:hypothetical protein